MVITEQMFKDVLGPKLGEFLERALKVFRNYGTHLGGDVVNVLLHAVDQGKVGEVLDILEKHYDEHLTFQHPEIRGTTLNDLGINETQAMFTDLCVNTLGLKPVETPA